MRTCRFLGFILYTCSFVSKFTHHNVFFFFFCLLDCSPTSLRARFPFVYANDSWPGKISSFEANMTEDLHPGLQKYYSKGIFTFTPPQDGE